MNIVKKMAIAATILCAATVANAGEGLKIGGTVNYIAMQPGGDGGKDADMSFLGAGVGVAFQLPLGDISVNPEVAFLYRQLYSLTVDLSALNMGKYEYNESEFAISVPITVRYNVSGAYAGAGVQLDLPLAAKLQTKVSGTPLGIADMDESVDFDNRASVDFGIAIVAGYNVSESIAAGAKAVIGLTEVAKDSKMTFNQYSVGVTYFF